jgi:hypothetical protein
VGGRSLPSPSRPSFAELSSLLWRVLERTSRDHYTRLERDYRLSAYFNMDANSSYCVTGEARDPPSCSTVSSGDFFSAEGPPLSSHREAKHQKQF